MRFLSVCILVSSLALAGCGATGSAGGAGLSATAGSGANQFNPHMNAHLPNMRLPNSEGMAMLQKMGGATMSIEGEAAHRPHWKQEIYPVFFGSPTSPHEVLVLLDFAKPASEKVWKAVAEAARSLPPQQAKIAVFAKSSEYYGTDLMGLGIWISYMRPGQAMPYMSYALSAWNASKNAQKRANGQARPFNNEFDSAAKPGDYPIHYVALTRLNPPIPANQELTVTRYCYDAGNVNLYQTEQIQRHYGVAALPAVIVDGKALPSVSADSILAAMR